MNISTLPGSQIQSLMENIKVAIRIRPFLRSEQSNENIIFTDPNDDRKIQLMKSENCFEGYYDKIYTAKNTQDDIFKFVKDSIEDVLSGINSTIFTYGQTGSGKTYTMFGSDWTLNEESEVYSQVKASLAYDKHNFIKNDFIINPFSNENGIVPKTISKIFSDIESNKNRKCTVYCSFLQIYNEKIYDLLEDSNTTLEIGKQEVKQEFNTYLQKDYKNAKLEGRSLNIREDKINGIYVEDLTEYIVENVYECLNLLKKGERNRKKRYTKKNEMSSRSHTVFMLLVEGDKINKDGTIKKAKLHLCDLAGSEKNDKEDNHKSMHFNEMVNINLSLGTLGKVIHALTTKQNHVPYRDSKLTRLLQDSLGGNTRTYFIATISPDRLNYDETVSTLKFADRAKSVLTKVRPNEVMAYDENLINKLTKEINELKSILAIRKKRGNYGEFEDQLLKLKEENEKLKKYVMANLTKENIEKLISENKILKLELQKLKSKNEFFINDNIDPDLLSSKNLTNSVRSLVDNNMNLGDYSGSSKSNVVSPSYLQNNLSSRNEIFNTKEAHYTPSSMLKSYINDSENIIQRINNLKEKNSYSINIPNSNLKEMKKYSQSPHPNKKLMRVGLDILSSKNSNFLNTPKDSSSITSEIKELKAANERLRFLEQMEKRTGLKTVKEIEKINSEKIKKKEEIENKKVERKKDIERIEGHLKRLNYLYKGKPQVNVYSDYLIESTMGKKNYKF